MKTYNDKQQENDKLSIATSGTKKGNDTKSSSYFEDNRSETVVQRQLNTMINDSPQVKQLKGIQSMMNSTTEDRPIQLQKNKNGLPANLQQGVENLSGYSMDDVNVHYNSPKPEELQAHAYAQGTDIHLGPGQEQHLPHEAWHVIQQKQGRVKPTMQMKGKFNINDDKGLEKEADVMGAKAMQFKPIQLKSLQNDTSTMNNEVIQRHPMTNKEMKNAGFGFMRDDRWQYNQDGYHVSAIRTAGNVNHFHVVGRWKGRDYNRIDFNEGPPNCWVECVVQLDRSGNADEMRDIARVTAPYFGGNIV